MTLKAPIQSQPRNRRAALTASMLTRCTASLVVLAMLAVVSLFVLRHQAEVAGQDARLVNLSGRQRMLVGRTAHAADRLVHTGGDRNSEHAESLVALTRQLEETHRAFLRGDADLRIPTPSTAVREVYLTAPYHLHRRMLTYLSALTALTAENPAPADKAASLALIEELAIDPWMPAEPRRDPSPVGSDCKRVKGLSGIDALVETIQRESEQRHATLELTALSLLALTIIVLALTATCVFLPMIRRVRRETARLEETQAASECRAAQLEVAVGELESLREDDQRRESAMLRMMDELRRERAQLRREATVRERAERQFRSVVEAAPHAMVMVDRNGKIVLLNKAAELVFEYDRDELIGRPIETLIPERFRGAHPQRRNDFFTKPRTTLIGQGRDLFGRRKDGTEFAVELGLNPIETEEGLFVLSSIVDLSARKQAHESAAKLAAIVESSHDAIIAIALDGTVTSWNRGAEKVYGYASHDVLGKSMSRLLPPGSGDQVDEILATIGRGELVDCLETVCRRRSGALCDVALTVSPITDDAGAVMAGSIVARDITHRKRAAKKLEQYAAELERSNCELQQFAYIASHDLKEPLRMVASYTQLLANEYGEQLDSEATKYITYATDGAKRMSALIDDLLNYSRVGRMDAPFAATRLDEIVQQVVNDLHARIEETSAEIRIAEPLPVVHGNRTRLGQLFQNLIGNALKFRHPGRRPVVQIASERSDTMWKLLVSDNGIGINPDHGERIFQVFQRLHTVDEYPGTGIGLAVCKKIVEHHGGEIWVESDSKSGTSFVFTLPMNQQVEKDEERKVESEKVEAGLCHV